MATEATINIRTVADLGRQTDFADKYDNNMEALAVEKKGKIMKYACLYGLSLGLMFCMYAAIFWYSAKLLDDGHIKKEEFGDIFKCLFSIMFAGMVAGEASSLAPDAGEAFAAATSYGLRKLSKKLYIIFYI